MDIDTIMRAYGRAKEIRQPWEQSWDDVFKYVMPGRKSLFTQESGTPRTVDVYDETAIVAAQEFTSRMLQGFMPPEQRWVRLEPGFDVPLTERDTVQAQLDEVTDYLFEILHGSNLSAEVHESMFDLAVGTGILMADEGKGWPVNFTSVSIDQCYLLRGPSGEVRAVFRSSKMTYADLKRKWPSASFPQAMIERGETQREYRIIESCMRDYTANDAETWHYDVVLESPKHALISQKYTGEGSCHYVIFPWSRTAGETWGRGPAFNALPAIRTTNFTVELILQNADLAVTGIWQAENDGVMNPDTIELVPGTIIPRAPGSRGLEPLQSPANFDVAQLVLSEMRQNIRKAMYAEPLGNPRDAMHKTPLSATEVAERMAELSRQMGAPLARMTNDLLGGVLRRTVYLLKKQGRVNLPKIDGREVSFRAVSPLARAQRNEEIVQITNFNQLIMQMFPQEAQARINRVEQLETLRRLYEMPRNFVYTEDEVAMQQAAQGQQLGQLAALAAEQGVTAGDVQGLLP